MRGPGSRLYAHAATPTPTHAISFKKAPLFKDGGIAAGDGGKRLSGAWSVDGASADFRPLRRADVAVTPPDRPLSPDESGGEKRSTYVGVWRATGTPFSSGLRTYAGNSGGSGREGAERRLKSAASAAAPRCSRVQRRRRKCSRERPTSRADPAAASSLPSARRPAAVCRHPQRPAGRRHLASLGVPGHTWGSHAPQWERSRTLPVLPVALFLFDPRVMASSRSFRGGGRGEGSPSPWSGGWRKSTQTSRAQLVRLVRLVSAAGEDPPSRPASCSRPSTTSFTLRFCCHGNRQPSGGRSPHVHLTPRSTSCLGHVTR